MVFMVSERTKYQARDPLLRTMVQSMWRHASTCAMAADWLARRLKYREREEAFLGALLHDIGELVLLRALDEFKTSEDPKFPLTSELVEEILNSAHAQLGYSFLKQRRIPEVYCHIARDHHLEPCDPSNVLMAIVRLADLSVRKLGMGIHPDPNLVLASTAEAACLDVNEIMLAELEVMIEDNVLAVA